MGRLPVGSRLLSSVTLCVRSITSLQRIQSLPSATASLCGRIFFLTRLRVDAIKKRTGSQKILDSGNPGSVWTGPKTHSGPHTHTHTRPLKHTHTHTHTHTNTDTYTHTHTHTHTHKHTNTHTHNIP